MPKVGDRVVVQGSKVGGGRREGRLVKVVGSLIQVRWEDGSETLMAPAAGTVQFLPGNGREAGKTAAKSAKKATAAKPSKAAPKTRASAGKAKKR